MPAAAMSLVLLVVAAALTAAALSLLNAGFELDPAYYLAISDLLGGGGGASGAGGHLGSDYAGVYAGDYAAVYSGTGMVPLPRLSAAEELVAVFFGPGAR